MFKLVAVGGKLRGQSFTLIEGDNIVGRSGDADISISVEGVSKKHFKITVNGKNCYIQDLDSANGTFVNKKLIKRLTVVDKDQVAVPNVIFQLVYVKEKIVKTNVEFKEESVDYSLEQRETPPKDFLGRMKFQFKHKVMQVLYSFNEQYDWNIMLAILVFLYACIIISVSIGPVLKRGNDMLMEEINARAKQYVNEVTRYNAIHMSRGEFQKIDTKYLDDSGKSENLDSYELIDMERRIVRPAAKIDTYSNDKVSIDAIDYYQKTKNFNKIYFNPDLPSGEVGVAKALQVVNNRTGSLEPVGVISMRFTPTSLENILIANSTAYLEALVYSCIIGLFFFGFIYYLTIKPLEQMRVQAINARAKRVKELSSDYLFTELKPIREEINGLLQSISELDGDEDSDAMIDEDDEPYIEALYEISKGMNNAMIILDSAKVVQHSNEKTYELIGLREDFSKDKDLFEAIEKDGLADELILLCDDSEVKEGQSMSEPYELAGENYVMHAKAMLGRSRTAKAYIITFTREI